MDVDDALQLLLELLVDAFSGDVHDFLLDCHQGVDWHPGVAEQGQFLDSVPEQYAVVFGVDENDFAQTAVLTAPAQQGRAELASVFGEFDQHVFSDEDLFDFEGVPVVAGVGNDCSIGKFVVADDVGHSLGFGVVVDPQGTSHLFPEVLDFDGLERGLDELVYFGQDAFLPVFQ